MSTMIKASAVITLSYALPLIAAPELIVHWKVLVLMALAAIMLLTQPAFDTGEARDKKTSDRGSVLIILGCGLLSQIIPLIEWAYFEQAAGEGTAVWMVAGGLMMLAGLAFRIWSIRTLGKYFTATVQIVDQHRLITTGPYAIVRHPSYLGAYVSIVGAAVFLAAPIGLVCAAGLMAFAYKKRLAEEERILEAKFGDEYLTFKKRVPCLVPLPRPCRG